MLTDGGTNIGGAYCAFDGAGNITETAFFNPGIPCGYYSVQTTGTVAMTFLFTGQSPSAFPGVFVSGQQVSFNPPTNSAQMSKILDPSKCQGHWTGGLQPTAGSQKNVNFDVDGSGLISSFTGLTPNVVGRMLSDPSNRVSAFFRTGAGGSDPYNQVRVEGTLSNNVVSGVFYLDQGGNSPAGTVNLQRQ